MEQLHQAIAALGERAARLEALLRSRSFDALWEGIKAHLEQLATQEYVGASDAAPQTAGLTIAEQQLPPRLHQMAYSDPALNLFRPPPMSTGGVSREAAAAGLAGTATPLDPAGVHTGATSEAGEDVDAESMRLTAEALTPGARQRLRDALNAADGLGQPSDFAGSAGTPGV